MQRATVLAATVLSVGNVQAHVNDAIPLLQHALEHGWLALLLLPLMFVNARRSRD